mmetsp:Transcript_25494/g.35065  ORF Transcript_25494/g.35065 Transcript_25494/m.35065 type:complete len:193 (+) Transcript_25494:224-802(+)
MPPCGTTPAASHMCFATCLLKVLFKLRRQVTFVYQRLALHWYVLPSYGLMWIQIQINVALCDFFLEPLSLRSASFAHSFVGGWTVPDRGLRFRPAYTVVAHSAATNKLTSSWRHCISISDDGYLIFFDLARFERVRSINLTEWCAYRQLILRPEIPRKLKCIHLYEDFQNGGMMVIGTSFGDVIACSLGPNL